MGGKRRKFTSDFKTQVALEALRGQKTVDEIAIKHGVHRNQVTAWMNQARRGLHAVFEGGGSGQPEEESEQEELMARLYQMIGQLLVKLGPSKKKIWP